MENVTGKILDNRNGGGGHIISLRYADDTTLLIQSNNYSGDTFKYRRKILHWFRNMDKTKVIFTLTGRINENSSEIHYLAEYMSIKSIAYLESARGKR